MRELTHHEYREALNRITPPKDRQAWLAILMAYKEATGDAGEEDARLWSASDPDSYGGDRSFANDWKSIKVGGGIGIGTLIKAAQEANWIDPRTLETTRLAKPAGDSTERKPAATKPRESREPAKPAAKWQPVNRKDLTPEQRKKVDTYCYRRAIEPETADKFALGYANIYGKDYLAIPYPDTGYYNCRAMADDTEPRYQKPAGATENGIFNLSRVLDRGSKYIFITEGEINAITIEQAGKAAIAGHATAAEITALKDAAITGKLAGRQFVIWKDPDNTGEVCSAKWKAALDALSIPAAVICSGTENGYKDANEYALHDAGGLADYLTAAEGKIAEEYNRQNRMDLFSFAELMRAKATEPIYATGFANLDNFLNGGMKEGLYIIGALSSAGKTSFAMQIAESIAGKGHDALVFSLEMSQWELAARSVARLSAQMSAGNALSRVGMMQIVYAQTGRYNISPTQADMMTAAIGKYSQIGRHLYINTGDDKIGAIAAEDIIAATKRHIELTGNAPVVFVDYLQILARKDPRETDLDHYNRAIVSLKQLSREIGRPVIVVSSINRNNALERANLQMYLGTSAIEYSADVCLMLSLDVGYNDADKGGKQAGKTTNEQIQNARAADPANISLEVLKNRAGRTTGSNSPIKLQFYKRYFYFAEV